MDYPQLTHGQLHSAILRHIIDHGVAPEVDGLAENFGVSTDEMIVALKSLADDHGVVLHPHTPKIWVIHPFSLAPTPFLLRAGDNEWWGNCAWCSLGAAALLDRDLTITTTLGDRDLTITTTLGANGRQVDIRLQDGRLIDTDFVVHFPVPMMQAWDNVIYTCSTMLLFEDGDQVEIRSTTGAVGTGSRVATSNPSNGSGPSRVSGTADTSAPTGQSGRQMKPAPFSHASA